MARKAFDAHAKIKHAFQFKLNAADFFLEQMGLATGHHNDLLLLYIPAQEAILWPGNGFAFQQQIYRGEFWYRLYKRRLIFFLLTDYNCTSGSALTAMQVFRFGKNVPTSGISFEG